MRRNFISGFTMLLLLMAMTFFGCGSGKDKTDGNSKQASDGTATGNAEETGGKQESKGSNGSNDSGYDKVVWGADIDIVKAAYPKISGVDESVQIDPYQPAVEFGNIGAIGVIENNVGNGITKRTFYFMAGVELFCVVVDYDARTQDSAVLRNKLESIYGKFSDEKPATVNQSTPYGNATVVIGSCSKTINANLKVTLQSVVVTFMGQQQASMQIRYHQPSAWQKMLDKYKKAEADSVGL